MGFDLSKHKSEHNYLPIGEFLVTVESMERKDIRDKVGYEYILRADDGRSAKVTFFDTEAAMWRLNKFASRCGRTEEQMKDFDWRDLLHCRVIVCVEQDARNPKYTKVENEFRAAEGGVEARGEGFVPANGKSASKATQSAPSAIPFTDEIIPVTTSDNDDIPF